MEAFIEVTKLVEAKGTLIITYIGDITPTILHVHSFYLLALTFGNEILNYV